ncbi:MULTISPECIES: DUF4232 domain-containing protein [Pseudonocardia]|uniref:DUF4232 domain-containing protein n=2 Tax=Pseudonocardia TaxID=1847 RepID=A0A1Y2N4I9_PSEAH|nr:MULTISPECIES: DUF4232 domain-containing protein [Pseudonocardia]OSY42376.1 hypothetical protein BG845_01296 [Pseudonocardia autotrophica]TDN75896.1 uncharacterized protein DUF4232 [Pseudonocardia autotrophica]BBF99868.1 hypothetical protein Pdca_10780 [Pseudonocardia autotrophica]GEC28369.1 hypothetical protein PSA01_53980 [Pseudonocardia saturnea]
MNTRLARPRRSTGILGRAAAAAVLAAGAVLAPVGVAHATPAEPAPSSCRPNHVNATVTPAPSSAGHRHYSVVLTAAPGTAPCTIAGSPSNAVFSLNGSPRAVEALPHGEQSRAVVFGPADPVEFDIQVPNGPGPAQANEVTVTPHSPDSPFPGPVTAHGPLAVDGGTLIGPVTEHQPS